MELPGLELEYVDGIRKEPDLVFYTLVSCAMCAKARTFLEERGHAYRYIYVDELSDDVKTALKSRLSKRFAMRFAFPSLVIDDARVILGFFPAAWERELGGDGSDG